MRVRNTDQMDKNGDGMGDVCGGTSSSHLGDVGGGSGEGVVLFSSIGGFLLMLTAAVVVARRRRAAPRGDDDGGVVLADTMNPMYSDPEGDDDDSGTALRR